MDDDDKNQTQKLAELLSGFDEELMQFESLLDMIAENTRHATGQFSPQIEGIKDTVYRWIQEAAPPED